MSGPITGSGRFPPARGGAPIVNPDALHGVRLSGVPYQPPDLRALWLVGSIALGLSIGAIVGVLLLIRTLG